MYYYLVLISGQRDRSSSSSSNIQPIFQTTKRTMTSGKMLLCIVLFIFAIQSQISYVKPVEISSETFKKLLIEASKNKDCARRVSGQTPTWLRFRRGPQKEKKSCSTDAS
ncbi:unnamed protein product [Rotaria magnacalcarata]|uniref:Uncharacterized protein n=1 Tax=Rotaria magnacalcarata TaxID=392030 RepID=A0A816UZ27_9BILA|nr:unnamed protein product [Rotaria magnacalcarata]CAF3769423.1 unnamed protein product [Rotaria magnacalcarata]